MEVPAAVGDTFVFEDHERWLHFMADQVRPWNDETHDDLVQEGALSMWKASQTFVEGKGASYSGWLHLAAKRRMMDIASQRKRMTRTEDRQNRAHKEPRRSQMYPYEAILPENLESDVPAEALLLDPTQPDVFEHVESGYHKGEVLKAVNELRPEVREYVVKRFWGGLEQARSEGQRQMYREIGHEDMLGSKKTLWREAQEELQFRLSHVRDGFGD